jgi:hypothetical protein
MNGVNKFEMNGNNNRWYLCNSKCEADRRFVGLFEELKLLKEFISKKNTKKNINQMIIYLVHVAGLGPANRAGPIAKRQVMSLHCATDRGVNLRIH